MFIRRSNGRFCDRVKKPLERPIKRTLLKVEKPAGVDGAQEGKSLFLWESHHRKRTS